MSTVKIVLVAVVACIIGVGFAVFGWYRLDKEPSLELAFPFGAEKDSDRLDRLPELRLPDLQGQEIDASRWAGKVVLLNFWATWCPPCLRELPLFDELQRAHPDGRLQVVGIAIDKKEDVQRFLAEHPVGFPVLLGDTNAIEISRRLGNHVQGLPFTAIFDHHGQRVYGQIGEMTRTSLSEHLQPLLSQTKRSRSTAN